MSRYDTLVQRLTTALTALPGETSADARRAFVRGDLGAAAAATRAPDAVAGYAARVAGGAWEVTDADVEHLKRRGLSEDEIFEITGAAAVGAALKRLERGMAALRGSAP